MNNNSKTKKNTVMKRKNLLWIIAAALTCGLATMTLTACSDDDDNNDAHEGQPLYDVANIKVIESGRISATDFYQRLIQSATEGNADEDEMLTEFYQQQLASIKAYEQYFRDSLANVSGANGSEGADTDGKSMTYSYEWTTIRYTTTDVDGNNIECSELLVWPYNAVCNPNPDNVVIGCHCTITSNFERPSNFSNLGHKNDVNMLACFANPVSQEALVIVPDYQGYGATHGDSHPYCNREVTARQVVDGVKAGITYFETYQKKLEKNWKSVAVGYSQGGAVAAGVLRYVQEHGLSELRLAGAVCGDGPYDPVATLQQYIKDDRLYMPVAAALLLKGAVDTNPRMRELGCRYDDFCTKDYVDTGIFTWLKDKEMTTDDIQQRLIQIGCDPLDFYEYRGNFFMYVWSKAKEGFYPFTRDYNKTEYDFDRTNDKALSFCKVSQCFKQGVIDYFKEGKVGGDVPTEKLKALEQCLTENQLHYSWKPSKDSGFTFFHSTKDEVVPVCNADAVDAAWSAGASDLPFAYYKYDNKRTYYHVATGSAFYVSYCGSKVSDILKGKWKGGRHTEKGGITY